MHHDNPRQVLWEGLAAEHPLAHQGTAGAGKLEQQLTQHWEHKHIAPEVAEPEPGHGGARKRQGGARRDADGGEARRGKYCQRDKAHRHRCCDKPAQNDVEPVCR